MAVSRADRVVLHLPPAPAAANWPCRIGVIPSQADCFQNRREVGALDEVMADGEMAVVCQVVSGTGGVGKTQIAAHYARREWDTKRLDLLVWVTASNRGSIVSAYAHAGARIAGADSRDPEMAAKEFLTWLETTDRKWLLVLDDLGDPGSLNGLWPPRRPTGRALVTTRRRDTSLERSGRRLVTVGLFTPDEGFDYLNAMLATRGLSDDPEHVRGLAEDLGFLPLALAQAVAYLIDRGLDCAGYRRRFTDRRRRLDEVFPEEGALPDEQRATVATTWSLSIELAEQLSPRGLARSVLRVASMLDANGVPMSVLTSEVVLRYLSLRRTPPDFRQSEDAEIPSPDDARDALYSLRRLNLVDLASDSPGEGVRIHGLIQRATRDELNAVEFDEVVQVAAEALLQAWPKGGTSNGEIMRANVSALRVHAGSRLWKTGAHPVLFHAGASLTKEGLIISAGAYWKEIHAEALEHLTPEHPVVMQIRRRLATWKSESGDVAGAVKAVQELLDFQVPLLGSQHAETLATHQELARQQRLTGDLAGAANTTRTILSEQLRHFGQEYPYTLFIRKILTQILTEAEDYPSAIYAAQELLGGQIRLLGPGHQETLATVRRINRLRKRLGSDFVIVSSAEDLINSRLYDLDGEFDAVKHRFQSRRQRRNRRKRGQKAPAAPSIGQGQQRELDETRNMLAEQLRVLGSDNEETLATRNRVVVLLKRTGDREGAAAAAALLIAAQLRVLGPTHPDLLKTQALLAELRGEAGDVEGALGTAEDLLVTQFRVLGPDHIDTLSNRGRIAHWREMLGDWEGAVRETEDLLAELHRTGIGLRAALSTRNNLWRRRARAGDWAGAGIALQQLLTDQLRVWGPDHQETGVTGRRLARLEGHAEGVPLLEAAVEEFLTEKVNVVGADHREVFATRRKLAEWRGEAGDADSAHAALEELLADQLSVLNQYDIEILRTRQSVSFWLREIGDDRRALAVLEELLVGQLETLASDDERILSTLKEIAEMRRERADWEGSLQAQRQILETQSRVLGTEHRFTLSTRTAIAQLQSSAGEEEAALATLEEVLKVQLRVLGPRHRSTRATRSRIAHCKTLIESKGQPRWRLSEAVHEEPPGNAEREGRFFLYWRTVDGVEQSLGPFANEESARVAREWAERGSGTDVQVRDDGG